MNKTYAIKTFGCQMNMSDSERISSFLDSFGWNMVAYDAAPDVILFNTCSVRQRAEDRIYGLIHNLKKRKKKNADFRIGITGCMVKKSGIRRDLLSTERTDMMSTDPLFTIIPNVDFVLRIEDLPLLPDYLYELFPQKDGEHSICNNRNEKCEKSIHSYFSIQPKYKTKTQIFVPIMTGCNHFCSYCIVPYTRGREISRPLSQIVSEIKEAAKNGCKEVTLLGQNVNSYQMGDDPARSFVHRRDKKSDFVILLEEIDKISGISRIRYASSHPRDFDDDLIRAHVELKSMCDYVHLPVQAGDNTLLSRMKREYTVEEYIEKIRKLRMVLPDVVISTDIIVGFCGETEKQFKNTLKLVSSLEFDLIYLAQYSLRKGTFAASELRDDVSSKEKHDRFHTLNNLQEEIVYKKNQKYVGKKIEVLVEEEEKGYYIGKTRDFKTVRFTSSIKNLVGEMVNVTISEAKTWVLEGKE